MQNSYSSTPSPPKKTQKNKTKTKQKQTKTKQNKQKTNKNKKIMSLFYLMSKEDISNNTYSTYLVDYGWV